jgi:hypothetical protein
VFTPPPNVYDDEDEDVLHKWQKGWHGLVIGWKMHSMYHGWSPDEEGEELGFEVERWAVGTFQEELSDLAASLVRLCRRSPSTCTADEMDHLDRRFLCRLCMNTELSKRFRPSGDLDGTLGPTTIGVEAYTWRRAVSFNHTILIIHAS